MRSAQRIRQSLSAYQSSRVRKYPASLRPISQSRPTLFASPPWNSRWAGLRTAHARHAGVVARAFNRSMSLSSLPTALVPPVVFGGLVLTLWFYKCCMMVLFQNKIIYMPSVPPFSRQEKISEYENLCKPVVWTERQIRSIDGTRISLCIGQASSLNREAFRGAQKHVIIIYFQGNASSLPPRLPALSSLLKALHNSSSMTDVSYSLVALSYRGYWTSSGRASQKGIELDALATLQWVQNQYKQFGSSLRVVLWGQSIGAGVAADVTARHLTSGQKDIAIHGLILETPFVSIRSMLVALYPQKWLPYRYLWPFLWNWWDSESALNKIAAHRPTDFPILMLPAAKDEVVPSLEADLLEHLCNKLGLDATRCDVEGALHNEASIKSQGRQAIVHHIKDIVTK